MISYVIITRPLNGLMAALAVYIGALIAGAPLTNELLYAFLSVFFISSGGMVINDYFDVEADRVNKPHRPIPSGKISENVALAYSFILFAAGMLFAYMISNVSAFVIAAVASLLLSLYAWKLKKVILIGHFSISLLVALTFIYGGLVAGDVAPTLSLALLAFLSNTAREIFKSVEDVLGDQKSGVETFAVKYGYTKAKMLASLFIILSIAFSFVPYFLGILGIVYLYVVVISDIAFLTAVVVPAKFGSKVCKLAMVIALVAFVAGALAQQI
jgi:geranylgeranylglycerol-phosphate geranylgeranyltransferase